MSLKQLKNVLATSEFEPKKINEYICISKVKSAFIKSNDQP